MTIKLDADLHIPIYSPTCTFCQHLNAEGVRCCAAFPEPDSIPMDIWMGQDGHVVPREGDQGITFTPYMDSLTKRGML